MTPRAATRVCYVLAQYPAMSATFIDREIRALEALGVRIFPISVNEPLRHDLLSSEHRRAQSRTTYIKAMGTTRIVALVARTAAARPKGFASTLLFVLRGAGLDGKQIKRRLGYLAEAVVVWDECRRNKIFHLHAHFGQGNACVAWFASELANRLDSSRPRSTWSFTVHGWLEFLNERDDSMTLKVHHATRVFAISDHTRSQLMRLSNPEHWSKIKVVRCGVELDRLPFRPEPVRSGPPTVLCVARLAPEKGHRVLFDALRLLEAEGNPVNVRLAGTGSSEAALRTYVAASDIVHRVTFLGPLGQDEVRSELTAADAFCLPSFSEGLPVALMESLAVGVPTIATAVAGVSELVEDGVTGYLVPAARADLLAKAIALATTNGDDRKRRQNVGRERVAAMHSIDRIGVELADEFRTFVRPEPDRSSFGEAAGSACQSRRESLVHRVHRRAHRFWLAAQIANGERARVGFDEVYRLRDPWAMTRPGEQARFEATARLMIEAFGTVEHLVELGSGEGHQSEVFARRCTTLTGLEASVRAVARAQRRLPGSRFLVGDLTVPRWSATLSPADVVTACEVLCYVPDVPAVLREMEALARKGCLITMYQDKWESISRWIESRPGVRIGSIRSHGLTWVTAWWPRPEP